MKEKQVWKLFRVEVTFAILLAIVIGIALGLEKLLGPDGAISFLMLIPILVSVWVISRKISILILPLLFLPLTASAQRLFTPNGYQFPPLPPSELRCTNEDGFVSDLVLKVDDIEVPQYLSVWRNGTNLYAWDCWDAGVDWEGNAFHTRWEKLVEYLVAPDGTCWQVLFSTNLVDWEPETFLAVGFLSGWTELGTPLNYSNVIYRLSDGIALATNIGSYVDWGDPATAIVDESWSLLTGPDAVRAFRLRQMEMIVEDPAGMEQESVRHDPLPSGDNVYYMTNHGPPPPPGMEAMFWLALVAVVVIAIIILGLIVYLVVCIYEWLQKLPRPPA